MLNEYLQFLQESFRPKYYFFVSIRLPKGKLMSPSKLEKTENPFDIYDWLMEDAGVAFSGEDIGKRLSGDSNIYYLCLGNRITEIKYENIYYRSKLHKRFFGRVNIDKIEKILDYMHHDDVFTTEQFNNLKHKIKEARRIKYLDNISRYLGEY